MQLGDGQLRLDLRMVDRVITHLNQERNVTSPLAPLGDLEQLAGPALAHALDLRLLFLRRVHLFDFYSLTQFTSREELIRRMGPRVLRIHNHGTLFRTCLFLIDPTFRPHALS